MAESLCCPPEAITTLLISYIAFANNENVREPSGKAVAVDIFHINYIKRTWMSLQVDDHTNSSQVSTSSHHAQVTSVKFGEISNLASFQVHL